MTELLEDKTLARKRKDEGSPPDQMQELLPAARHVAPLNKPGDVTKERKRLYRATINGKIAADEAARLNFMLTGIRADLEADMPPVIEHGPDIGPVVDTINIVGVPSGWSVTNLFGSEAHIPTETLHKLRELLPADAFAPPSETGFLSPPSPSDVRPFLRLLDNDTPETPPPAA